VSSYEPSTFLRLAGTFVLLSIGLCITAWLVLSAAWAGPPRIDPNDDWAWLPLTRTVLNGSQLEGLDGATREQVVARLGQPLRVHRDNRGCDGCSDRYVYALQLEDERVPVAVCFTPAGLAAGTCGCESGMQFDLRSLSRDGVEDMVFGWPRVVLLALPFAILRRVRLRARPFRVLSIK
jgi:hypothetical protein